MPTIEERFNAAVSAAQGHVHLRLNVMECCRSCITPEKLELPNREALDTTPYAYHYGGQDNQLVWKRGLPHYMEELNDEDDESPYTREADEVYFNHGGPSLQAAQVVADSFRAQGFTVDWTGDEFMCVIVRLGA
jgi:hypothetical protein